MFGKRRSWRSHWQLWTGPATDRTSATKTARVIAERVLRGETAWVSALVEETAGRLEFGVEQAALGGTGGPNGAKQGEFELRARVIRGRGRLRPAMPLPALISLRDWVAIFFVYDYDGF